MKDFYVVILFVFSAAALIKPQNSFNDSLQNLYIRQNFPNPFNSSTEIEYYIPHKTYVEINIYNVLGVKLKTLAGFIHKKGWHTVEFNADEYPSGLYMYEIKTPYLKKTRKMLHVK